MEPSLRVFFCSYFCTFSFLKHWVLTGKLFLKISVWGSCQMLRGILWKLILVFHNFFSSFPYFLCYCLEGGRPPLYIIYFFCWSLSQYSLWRTGRTWDLIFLVNWRKLFSLKVGSGLFRLLTGSVTQVRYFEEKKSPEVK